MRKLFEGQLAEMYGAEQQLQSLLPKLAAKSHTAQVRAAFLKQHVETEGQLKRLEKVFRLLGKVPKSENCAALEGIIREAGVFMHQYDQSSALDAALVATGQKADHYGIATYGFMCEWAKELGLSSVQDLFHQTLEEKIAADERSSLIAERSVISEAVPQMVKKT